MAARLAALLGLAQSPGYASCSVGPGMLLARWRALRGARVTPSATTVVQSQGQEGDEAEHPARDYYRRARDVSSRSVARSIASCSQLYRNQGLPTCCSRNVPVGNPLSVHAVAASAPSATWWTDVPSETPNNISFITSFGPSPRACICWYRCEPQWTAEAQYPASKPYPSYVDFSPPPPLISSLAMDLLSHVCKHQQHIDPCETQRFHSPPSDVRDGSRPPAS